jgi:hypothetical protein
MPSLGAILGSAAGNDSVQQIFTWGVLYGLTGSVFDPVNTEVAQEVWEGAVGTGLHRALSADLLAVMVVRGWLDEATGEAEAAKTGIDPTDFQRMVNNSRNPISPQEAAVALRRQIIPATSDPGAVSFQTAIQEGNLGDQWGPVIQALATQIPSPADVLRGVLQGQVPAGTDPRALYQQVGGELVDPNTGFDWYTFLFNTEGQAPSPLEAAEMARRGIIPWGTADRGPIVEGPLAVSFHQAFLEGPWRDKWEPAFEGLSDYVPPPRTVTTLLRSGAITVAQATTFFEAAGLSPALADAYIASASSSKVSTAKNLNETTVVQLYLDKLVDEPTASAQLVALGYTASEANLLLQSAGLRQTIADLNKNIGRVGTYYIAHKIDQATAQTMLASLGLPADQIAQYITGWSIDREANVKLLTPAQIADAWEYGIFTQDDAQASLEQDGYTPFDAWTILSIKAKAPQPNPPARGPAPIQ